MVTQEKSIKMAEKTWRKLTKLKLDLNCKSLDEVINRMFKILKIKDLRK